MKGKIKILWPGYEKSQWKFYVQVTRIICTWKMYISTLSVLHSDTTAYYTASWQK